LGEPGRTNGGGGDRRRADLGRHLGHVALLHCGLKDAPSWCTIFVDLATGLLMLTFAISRRSD